MGEGDKVEGSGPSPEVEKKAAEPTSHPVVLFVESDKKIIDVLRIVLRDAGFTDVRHADTVEGTRTILETEPVDLVLAEANLSDGAVSPLFREMRESRLGLDPFVPIIAMVSSPDPDLIRGLVDNGPDDVILKPFSAKALSQRIERIIEDRKPFVVTRDYVGPDRRAKPRTDSTSARPLLVPNTLKQKIKKTPAREEFEQNLKKAVVAIAEARVAAQAGGVLYQIDRILLNLAEGKRGEAELAALDEIISLSSNIKIGASATRYAGEIIVFNTVLGLAQSLRASDAGQGGEAIGQLQELAGTIRKAFQS